MEILWKSCENLEVLWKSKFFTKNAEGNCEQFFQREY